jgi:NAD(P)-dependent dehydrogenase (short-subunit alcohol dehydrogenase family)
VPRCPKLPDATLSRRRVEVTGHPGNRIPLWAQRSRSARRVAETELDVSPKPNMGDRRMAVKLRDTVVVVTGASSGIGRATTELLAESGATVIAVARREEPLRELADRYPGDGNGETTTGRVVARPADVTDAEAIEQIAVDTIADFGRLDAWVNNAAVNQYGNFEELPLDEWRRVVETNLFGYVHGARAAIPYFREQGRGVLVNVSSVLGKVPSPLQSAYIASKFGINGLSAALRQELQDVPGVTVSTVMPGPIDTPLFQHAANHTGYRITPPAPTVDASRVALAIAKNIRRPRPEVPVGVSTRPALFGRRLMPRATERIAAPASAAAHLTDEPSDRTAGNVMEPVAEGSEVSGGWKPSRAGKPGRTLAILVAAGAVAATAWRVRSREQR